MTEGEGPWRPSKEQLLGAEGSSVADVIRRGLDILFCGINPGLYSAAVGHHFARPGNRFWGALHAGGLTPTLLNPFQERRLLDLGMGITNLVQRASASAADLSHDELREGAIRLEEKARDWSPATVAMLGVTAYRPAFGRPEAVVGLQPERLAGARLWLLPNPSGLNAHYQLDDLAHLFRRLREQSETDR